MNLTQEDDLLIQSHFSIVLLTELNNNEFLHSEYFEKMSFGDRFVKNNLPKIGIDNQGSLLIFLYVMLVIPRELIENKFPNEFQDLNDRVNNYVSSAKSNYKKDKDKINYLYHIRNSVAHARVVFTPNVSVTFHDNNKFTGENCSITIPLKSFGIFLEDLRDLFMKYVEDIKQRNK